VSGYARGVAAEKRTAAQLRKDGYFVVESRGSHGLADLLAVKLAPCSYLDHSQVLMIQVKGGEARLDGAWWNDLHDAARRAGALPIVADWPKRGHLRLRQITGQHQPRSKLWPCALFVTDEVEAGGVVPGR
jgi:hypothetical protein